VTVAKRVEKYEGKYLLARDQKYNVFRERIAVMNLNATNKSSMMALFDQRHH